MRYLLLLLLFPFLGTAQTIVGTVSDVDGEPVEQVLIVVGNLSTYSNDNGQFRITAPADFPGYAILGRVGYKTDTIYIPEVTGEYEVSITIQRSEYLEEIDVRSEGGAQTGNTELDSKNLQAIAGPQSSVEGLIRTLPGVIGRSEFSSQYNVRGGSFDENLVYLNGIEVYRPFLVRAGQQEGLSFINPDMVDNISFSAGGFSAIYGDKMSSVLDITYKEPEEFEGTFRGSLLGGQLALGGRSKDERLTAMGGIRYQTNRLLLGALDTDGDFTSNFFDAQLLLGYTITEEWKLNFLGNIAQNDYRVQPGTRNTQFGSFQEALQLTVFFEGQENYQYNTTFGALSTEYAPHDDLSLSFYTSAYQTVETEYVDVIGLYRLGDLNTNLGSDDFGEIASVRGVGGFHQYARNTMDAIIFNVGHRGVMHMDKGSLYWGGRLQREDIVDRYKEWEYIDSAGYSVTHQPTQIVIAGGDTIYIPDENLEVWENFDTRGAVTSWRSTAYVDYVIPWESNEHQYRLNAGVRGQYWTWSGQLTASPRMRLSWRPANLNKWLFTFASGLYHQPAFYREMRDLQGEINPDIRAQLAVHYVAGGKYTFEMWDRPFVLNTEAYYKDMYNLIPYEIDNVRIRYSAVNEARGRAYGIDTRLNGEFVKGVESWASLSIFRVEEDIEGDGAGYIPRPTDQRFNFSLFFQDYLPQNPTFRVNVNLVVTGGFPFGAPQTPRFTHTFRSPMYRRLDLGFIKVFRERDKEYKNSFYKNIDEFWVSLEVFNVFESRNTVSYLWVRDVSSANQYAVPNYLTSRLLNLKVHVSF
ncbi:TonB-dependent receptor [Phaeocystidibacter luteus]|uniref:TonB-dependent receptor plug domain-containing protein n=1 Tax=Phaeocystidibacter luteus TaxID=911197 RepID=A0A6N6RJX4_9FLAO|nr:TonB-dependent receptor plug domain-containing protein [Phaeocystidibacter luteus]KAB2814151.1 TonB-dependent receptor plug domain-containing protein [Phaeocystidibacter luteus]